jgi:CubicO group peptidase (beta-lactamase class C family)
VIGRFGEADDCATFQLFCLNRFRFGPVRFIRYDLNMKMKTLIFALFFGASGSIAIAQAPYVDPALDAQHFGAPENILFWKPEEQVAGYRNMDQLVPVRWVHAGDAPLQLPEQLIDLDSVVLETATGGMTVAQYIEQQSVAGLLVLKDGSIVYERYELGNNQDSRWISYSVTKSVVSMLLGAAIRDGYIKSVDEMISDYLPRLRGSAYDQVRIRDILQMASGVAWNENYSGPEADVNQVSWETLELYDHLADQPRTGKSGTVFNYNTAETNLVGTLLRAAIGNNLSTYLEEKIWRPFGMEADASWSLTEPGGGEFGGCCINATLRDYGRLGLFALNEGRLPSGEHILPEGWMRESLTPSEGSNRYGYLWWLGEDGAFEASGIFGQGIFIHPVENLVIAIHSARPEASNDEDWALQSQLYRAIAKATKKPIASP